ncbi:MAG: ABC transporter permease [Gemmatimonadales bacterium]|nr:ABC transporter permease [Gemmatimonadales bacterium]
MPKLEFGRRLRQLWWRPSVADEVDAEVQFHLEMRIKELVARGLSPEAARAEAVARLGDGAAFRATLRRLGRERNTMRQQREWFDELSQDIRYAIRSLRQQPGFTLTALVTLAIGIGATTAIFSFLYSVVLRPLPIPEADRVVVVGDGNPEGPAWSVSVGNYVDYRRETRAFERLGAMYSANFNLSVDASPERVAGARVDAEYFGVFRIAPALGRIFTEDEDRPGAARVVILSDGLWRRRFGADAGIVGRTITIDGTGHQVVGVMPPAFGLWNEELWTPAGFTPEQLAKHDEHFLEVFGRLKPGVSVAQALADQDRIARQLAATFPLDNHGLRGAVEPLFDQFVGNAPERLGVLFGAVLVVLLIACVNVANLLLARGAARERELALRAALGAGRRRIVRQLITENLVLAVGAGLLGIGLAGAAIKGILVTAPRNLPRLDQAGLDGWVVAFAVAVSLGSVLLFGLVPAVRSAGADLARTLREGAKGSSATTSDWLRRGLVAAEVALALILLVGAGLLIRTAIHLGRIDPGFRPDGVLTARVGLPQAAYPAWDQVTNAFSRIHEELRRAPGVETAGLSSQVPLGPGGGTNGLIREGLALAPENAIGSRLRLVTPGYLATMRIPIIRGRDFTAEDRRGTTRVMIVSKGLAERAWPGQDPIGKRMACCEGTETDPMWKEVVGVVGDVRSAGIDQDATPEFYLPIAQAPAEAWNWIQRTMMMAARGPESATLTAAVRAAVRSVDPTVPVYGVASMGERIAMSLAQGRFNTRLLTGLGAVGLILAAIGIYGVIGYFVARQSRELGIRVALGASTGRIRALVLRQGLVPAAIGVGIGIPGSLVLARLLGSQLRGVGPGDPITFLTVAIALLGVAALAALGPARRATRVDPTTAMREE